MPIILDTWEAEAGASQAQDPYEQLSKTLSQIEEGLGVQHRGKRLLNSVPYNVKRRKVGEKGGFQHAKTNYIDYL